MCGLSFVSVRCVSNLSAGLRLIVVMVAAAVRDFFLLCAVCGLPCPSCPPHCHVLLYVCHVRLLPTACVYLTFLICLFTAATYVSILLTSRFRFVTLVEFFTLLWAVDLSGLYEL